MIDPDYRHRVDQEEEARASCLAGCTGLVLLGVFFLAVFILFFGGSS